MAEYNFRQIEDKWQKYWRENRTFATPNQSSKPKYYILDMFPYPSGAGLHVGHPLGYIATDIVARFKRLQGFNVLHPMGFDAFGLPAEQYAIQTGQHPAVTTAKNIARYKEQLDNIGLGYDWSREVQTCAPDYYRWTQWIFKLLFESWYDRRAGKARPISELEAHFSQHGSAGINAAADDDTPPITAEAWNALSAEDKYRYTLKYRLAFLAESMVNWCPALGTVLANEEVKDGVSERGGYPVIRKSMQQWCLRITAYADRLLSGLDTIDWPEAVKEMQRNWIGKSTGALVQFPIEGREDKITVFTTRIDTIFGVTFLSLAPENELVSQLVTPEQKAAVDQYVLEASRRSELDRMSDVKTISGVSTGAYATNPFNGERMPIWVADYVLGGYGTGAVMAVPSSDTRDYAFAKHFDLPIVLVQEGEHTDISQPDFDAKAGTMINSGFLNSLPVTEAIKAAIAWAEEKGVGRGKVNYRLRDAIFSRQRYWGEPFPVYYKDGLPYLLPDEALPLNLPEVDAYLPTEDGEPPLARAKDFTWQGYPLETNTMPGWAGSSWYFFRYMDAQNGEAFASQEALDYWQNVDFYLGGSEHATGHLLYSRFWTKLLHDLGYVKVDEPFKKLINQGMIQGVSQKARIWIDNQKITGAKFHLISADMEATSLNWNGVSLNPVADDVSEMDLNVEISLTSNNVLDLAAFEGWRADYQGAVYHVKGSNGAEAFTLAQGAKGNFLTTSEVEKMSKSKFNVVNPDEICDQYGADTLRLYEMFLGPLEQSKPWNTNGIEGVAKFLRKLWRLYYNDQGKWLITDAAPSAEALRLLHKAIKKVSDDIDRLNLNTSVSTFMVLVNELGSMKCTSRQVLEQVLILLSPYAPHIAEELWSGFGHTTSIVEASWPVYDADLAKDDVFECPVSMNGKMRVKLQFPLDTPAAEIEAAVLADETVQKWLEGKPVRKIVVVPNRIVNVVY